MKQIFDPRLLGKLVTLHSWAPECLGLVRKLAEVPSTYQDVLARLESCLEASEEDNPRPEVKERLEGERERRIYDFVVWSAPLLRLFQSEPRLSQAPALTVATLSRFADVSPHPRTVLQSHDLVFMRVLKTLEKRTVSAGQLLLDDLFRLVSVHRNETSAILLPLEELAKEEDWTFQMSRLEAALETRATEPPEGLKKPALQLFDQITLKEAIPQSSQTPDLREVLVQEPRFSSLLREEIMAFQKIRKELPEKPEDLLSSTVYESPSYENKMGILAAWARDHLIREDRDAIECSLQLRIEAAQHFLGLRAFAKIDAFRHCWPDLGDLLSTNLPRLYALESEIVDEQAPRNGLDAEIKQDQRLVDFLRLRPTFREIYPADVNHILDALKATEAQAQALRPSLRPAAEVPRPEVPQASYENVVVHLRAPLNAQGAEDGQFLEKYEVEVIEEVTKIAMTGSVVFPWAELAERLDELQEFARASTGLSQMRVAVPDEAPNRDLTRTLPFQELDMLLQELGERMYELTFVGEVRALLSELLQKDVRILLILRSELMVLPWESLYVRTPLRNFPALTRRYSMLRFLPPPEERAKRFTDASSLRRMLTPPLRLLAVLPNPRDTAPLNTQGEEAVLRRTLEAAIENGQVQLEVLQTGEATPGNLQRKLRVFRPHLFHFVGHGMIVKSKHQGAIVLENENDGSAHLMLASDLASALSDSGVLLAVLNACDTGTAAANEAIAGVAGALVNAGTAAVLATMRPVQDQAALLFARELYRSLVDGYSLEAAVSEARRILKMEGWDWSLYVLFTRLRSLDAFRLDAESGKS